MKYAFLGNMNNMSYMFAREMKKCGHDVTLFIDVPADYKLDRPEAMDLNIGNIYPEWIIELKSDYRALTRSILKLYTLPLFKNKYLRILNPYDVIILNGSWIRLGKYISKRKKVMNLFAGHDLDVLASIDKINPLNRITKKYPFFRPIVYYIFKSIVKQQQSGIKRADAVNYYPTGINPVSDNLLKK
ncbi:MAG: hypothetical protein IPJ81_03515 [Chitinophagaceae bacterium]|nr:hypothetical protein [Chitinophagaceae bacterium]